MSHPADSLLFTPFRLGKLELCNRIVLPAMVTRLSGEDGRVNDRILDRYIRFAEGEPGLVVIEAMAVHRSRSGPLLRICDDEFVPGLADLAARMHAVSRSKVAPQIIHFLKIARNGYRQKITDLSRADMMGIRDAFVGAALRSVRAGFDAVELHMAHAYTLSSFLSKRNLRPDEYGRSHENRLRFPLEVLQRVRDAVGPDFPVGIRFLADECIKDGATAEETKFTALRFAQNGAAWLSISNGGKFEDAVPKAGEPLYPYTGYSGDRCMPGRNYPDGANLPAVVMLKEFLRTHGLQTPVVAAGKIHTFELAEQILQNGSADLIGMARALLADPDLPRKWRDGRPDTVVGCVYSNVCKTLDENFREVRCYLWPKGALQAPRSNDMVNPVWPAGGAALAAAVARGRVELRWTRALDAEGIYGYEVFRGEAGGPFVRIGASRGSHYHDESAVAGVNYQYYVRAYDLAGNRSERSDIIYIQMESNVFTQ